MIEITGELIAKAENETQSVLAIRVKGTKPAEHIKIELPASADISELKRGNQVIITIN